MDYVIRIVVIDGKKYKIKHYNTPMYADGYDLRESQYPEEIRLNMDKIIDYTTIGE